MYAGMRRYSPWDRDQNEALISLLACPDLLRQTELHFAPVEGEKRVHGNRTKFVGAAGRQTAGARGELSVLCARADGHGGPFIGPIVEVETGDIAVFEADGEERRRRRDASRLPSQTTARVAGLNVTLVVSRRRGAKAGCTCVSLSTIGLGHLRSSWRRWRVHRADVQAVALHPPGWLRIDGWLIFEHLAVLSEH